MLGTNGLSVRNAECVRPDWGSRFGLFHFGGVAYCGEGVEMEECPSRFGKKLRAGSFRRLIIKGLDDNSKGLVISIEER
jgi:hypothetical protein